MRQLTIKKFSGLKLQPNSLTVNPGACERLDNAILTQDFMIGKCRGFRRHWQLQDTQIINAMFDYQTSQFTVTQDKLYRMVQTATTATAYAVSGSTDITVRKTAHGLSNNDYISDFVVDNDDDFVAAFPDRQADFYGIRQVTTTFTANASRSANVVTVTLPNHGMQTGDTISVTASTLSPVITVGVYTITSLSANTFSIAQVAANSSGTVTFAMVDSFRITALEAATATIATGTNAASYRYYTVVTGVTIAVTAGGVGVSRQVKSNKNAYLTTDNGIVKLERQDLPTLKAGIPPALDMQGVISGVTGPFTPNKQVAYRVLYGRRDANNNLVLGAPGESLVLRNTVTAVSDANLSYNTGTHVVTVTSPAHGLTTNDIVYLFDVTVVSTGDTYSVPNGSQVAITVTGATTFTFDLDDISSTNVGDVTDVTALSWGVAKTPTITSTIPSEILSTQYIVQIYRSPESVDLTTSPEPRYKIVEERNLTSTEIANGFITFTDEVDEILISGNAELYTNPTQEGELQANTRPPRADDMALFKGYVFYANVVQYRTLALSVIAPSNIANGDYITIGTQVYIFRGNASNQPVGNESVTDPATTATYVEVTHVNHGFLVNDVIRVTAVSGVTGITTGLYTVTAVPTPDTFRFGTGAGGSGTITYEGVTNAAGNRLVKLFQTFTGGPTLSESIANTARALVKAINRNSASTIYAQYISQPDESPGKMFYIAKDVNASSYAVTANTTTVGEAFLPILPTSGTSVSDQQDANPNDLSLAKFEEPEAAPILDRFPVGSKEFEILRVAALRDSLIILKQDGVFRLNGDSKENFTVTVLDSTVILKASDSVAVLNNSVYCFTNQGVVQITDSSVRIVSRDIEPVLSAIVGDEQINNVTAGVGYESERVYLLSTIQPNSTSFVSDIINYYNYLTDGWTTWSLSNVLFANALLSTLDDKLLVVQADETNAINKERKQQTKVDFTGQDYVSNVILARISTAQTTAGSALVTVTTTVAHGLTAGETITVSRAAPAIISAFSGGAADVDGLHTVASVVSDTVFRFTAGSNALSGVTSSVYYINGLSELDVEAAVVNGNSTVTITTSIPHGLSTGTPVTIYELSPAIAACFSDPDDLLGYRTITVTGATTFTVIATNAPIGSATDDVEISDGTQERVFVTVKVEGLTPQMGDAIVAQNRIYKITAVKQFESNVYNVTLLSPYKSLSTALAFVHEGYRTSVKFSPIGGDEGKLKYYSEFQTSFRNSSSCSMLKVSFANDAFVSTNVTLWSANVGTPRLPINFGGWGSLPWGNFPWGGGSSIQRDFRTGSAVILRMYVPKDTFVGTFIQPVLEHRVAGEPLEIQSISLYTDAVTQRTTK